MSAVGIPVFTPIPPGFDVKQLAEEPGSHFHLATRVDARTLTPDTAEQFDEIYRSQVLQIGEPLVIENWHLRSRWPGHIFKDEWLDNNLGRQRKFYPLLPSSFFPSSPHYPLVANLVNV